MKYTDLHKYFWQSFLLVLLFWQIPVFSQSNQNIRLFLDVNPDTFITRIDTTSDSLKLPHHFLVPRSERIYRNSFKLLRGVHYRVNARKGNLYFSSPLSASDSLTVIYQKYPFPLISEYSHRELRQVSKKDTSDSLSGSGERVISTRLLDEIDSFSGNLDRSGSIVRGIEIGNNRDLTLNSGLNLQLSGYITQDVQLVAALTDESTPIQPEGNTQTLREVDKVFVKINSPHIGGTLGDFNLNYQNSLFGNVSRKLQGITANGSISGHQQQLTYATSTGTFNTNQFLGQEGNQGPYQLVGKNGEREIIVLAGTEEVFVNGERQIRGENNDYIIDYSLGQITFTNKRLITSEDRIEVDFEFANNFQRYGKSFVGFSTSNPSPGSNLQYDVRLFREWDDTNNLLEDSAPLSDEEKLALETAGDNPFQAGVSGANFLGDGEGNYVKRDTVIGGDSLNYYLYSGRGQGDYSVRFSGVGQGNGSYVKERIGVYRFVGPNRGSYLPIRLVPLAGDKKFADARLSYRFGQHFSLNTEAAVSNFDQNIFSGLHDDDNSGQAYNIGANYKNEKTRLFGKSIGALNWQVDFRQRQEQFEPLDRQFQPEYNYRWNLSSTELLGDQQILESTLRYRPTNFVRLNFDGGWIQRGTDISSGRGRAELSMQDSTWLKGNAYWEQVASESSFGTSEWQRFGGQLGKQIWKVFSSVKLRREDRQVKNQMGGVTGFRFTEASAGLKLFSLFGMEWNFDSNYRLDHLYDPNREGERLKLSTAATHKLAMNIRESQRWQGRVSFAYRNKDFQPFFEKLPRDSMAVYQTDPQFQDTTWGDRQSHLANLELQYRNEERTIDSRWEYQVASELQAMQEKVFLEVGENRGNYRFDEELQEYVPDSQGDFFLIVVPTGNFESVTNIEASWQLRYRPKFADEEYSGWQKILHNISTFTFLKVDEKSREQNIWQLYILNLEKYHNQATTLRGSYTINQDVHFFERNPDFGITLRSRFRDNLSNQFVDAGFNESTTFWTRSINWRQRLWKRKLSQEVEYEQTINNREVSAVPSRNRDVFGQSVFYKINYRPVYAWQLRLDLERGWQEDKTEANRLDVRYWEINPQVNYSMRGKARGTFGLTYLRVDVTENPFNRPIPYEMGKGKKVGNSFLWNFRFEYFISSNITMTVNYTGRRDAGMEQTIHLGQAEVRAFF